jgi:hypothetical protein
VPLEHLQVVVFTPAQAAAFRLFSTQSQPLCSAGEKQQIGQRADLAEMPFRLRATVVHAAERRLPPIATSRTLPIRRSGDVRNSICRRARPALRTARFINSHKKAVAAYLPASAPPAVGTTSGRRRCRVVAADGVLGIGFVSLRRFALRYKEGVVHSRAAHYFFCIHLCSSLPPPNCSSAARPAAARAASACCDVVGSPINPPTSVFNTQTPRQTIMQSAVLSAARSALC